MECPKIPALDPVKQLEEVRRLLDSGRRPEEVLAELAGYAAQTAVAYVVNRLRQAGAEGAAALLEGDIYRALVIAYFEDLVEYISKRGVAVEDGVLTEGACCAAVDAAKVIFVTRARNRFALSFIGLIAGRRVGGMCLVPYSTIQSIRTLRALAAAGMV
ncbi:MAG: hypothetical protein C0167_02980 [Nitrososphaera sp.]|nr:MAG: hypothetical protein C0167_02980 [Nitrososphaera sp.]